MIIEHSGDFKVVDPKTKEVRYDSSGCYYNLLSGGLISSNSWNIGKVTTGTALTIGNTTTEGNNTNPLEKSLSAKDQILELLKGETYCDILQLLTDVELEVREKLKY